MTTAELARAIALALVADGMTYIDVNRMDGEAFLRVEAGKARPFDEARHDEIVDIAEDILRQVEVPA